MSTFKPRLVFNKTLVADFETTVYKDQTETEVWASACVELKTEDVKIFHSIEDTYEYFKSFNENILVYYHNLKFDGQFWLSYLLTKTNLKQAYVKTGEGQYAYSWIDAQDMSDNSFKYTISDMGQWYCITIKVNNKYIEIRDSLKLLPFSVKKIGNSFQTKHRKLEMEYKGFRYAGCLITDEEKEYIKNDVLVVKEALEIMFNEGHKSMTIGSCCLSEYKNIVGRYDYPILFPDMTQIELNIEKHKYANADKWIRKSYKGGWCYVVKGKANKLKYNGTTADVNSLYPSMMSSESGNRFPVGRPTFWFGNYIPDEALLPDKYYFIRIRTRFYLKKGYLPFIQIKDNFLYKSTECLETSDVFDKKEGVYHKEYFDKTKQRIIQAIPELTLTMTDFKLMKEHYELIDFEIIDGCYFNSEIGIFDSYIEKYKKIKLESKGAIRELAKLFLNNLYGKLSSSTESSFKLAYVKDNGAIGFHTVTEFNKKTCYIPCGSAITSYARNFTIRTAQMNYYGDDERGFIYADTDSIHCDLQPSEIKGIKVHDRDFCCWKLESCWSVGLFVRQKTYIELINKENLNPVNEYYNIKCAGMPTQCKELLEQSITQKYSDKIEKYDKEKLEFIHKKRDITDFKIGLLIPAKLVPKVIKGGVVLVDTTYELRR